MTFVVAIVLFYAGLLLVVIPVHELGHYLVARRFGFKIEEYFVGFGPKLWSTRRGEVEYGVKALPVGGYVKITGMDPFKPVPPEDLPRAYGSKPPWQRALVILAGPLSHFLIAFVLFSTWVLLAHIDPYHAARAPLITAVVSTLEGNSSPASDAGLQAGDRIVKVGPVTDFSDGAMSDYTTAHIGDPVPVTIARGKETFTVTMTPVAVRDGGETIGRVGIFVDLTARARPMDAPIIGARQVGTSVVVSFASIGKVFGPDGVGSVFRSLFLGEARQSTDPQSVVGIGQTVGHGAERGRLIDILNYLGFVTVFVGILNLLPLPPFDGGHLAVLVIEKVRGKTIDMRKLIPISAVVMTFLIVFVGMTVVLDFTNPVQIGP